MAEALFHVGVGVNLADSAHVLYGSGSPDTVVSAPRGSIYMRTSDGSLWHNDSVAAIGTEWTQLVDATGASLEDGYQNTFAGKSGTGSITPTYTDENHISDGDSLMLAIDKLDQEIGAAITGQEVRTFGAISDQSVNDNILALDNAIGSDAEHSSTIFTTVNASLNTKISELDLALSLSEPFKSSETAVTTPSNYAVDSVAVATVSTVEWLLTVKSDTTPANRKTYKVIALNDGTITNIDWTKFAILKVGSNITGLSIDVVGAAGNMELQISASEDVDYNVSRITLG